jgi:hypothetical protein
LTFKTPDSVRLSRHFPPESRANAGVSFSVKIFFLGLTLPPWEG